MSVYQSNILVLLTFTKKNFDDFLLCNRSYFDKRKQFFLLKTTILNTFGTFDGYDLQEWYDYDSWDWGNEEKDIYAWHEHILKRFVLGGRIFHEPTNEFHYGNNDQIFKTSSNYGRLRKCIKGRIKGKKKVIYPCVDDQIKDVDKAFKRLMHKFYYL